MHPALKKTFGGLSTQYFFRQLFFAVLMAALFIFFGSKSKQPIPLGFYFFIVISTLLYPYSRYVYESIINFILGENIFIVNAIFVLIVKITTMFLCWFLAIFIAPVGLLYLYFRNSRIA